MSKDLSIYLKDFNMICVFSYVLILYTIILREFEEIILSTLMNHFYKFSEKDDKSLLKKIVCFHLFWF